MKKTFWVASIFCISVFAFQSCKKDEVDAIAEKTTAEDIVSLNDLGEIIDAEIDESIPNNLTELSVEDRSCATVTYAQPKGTWPNTITIDYGTGCTQSGGITLKGKIIVAQTNKMSLTGATRTVTYDGFFIENAKVEGQKVLTNTGSNSAGQPVWTKTGNQTLTYPNGDQASRTINHVRTMIEGASTTAVRADDVWSIKITDTGTGRNGNAFTVTSSSDLIRKFVCPWISDGVLEFTLNSKVRTLDFGDGTCDRDAVLTLADGTEKEVKIRHRWWK